MNEFDQFNYTGAAYIKVNDGCIKGVWIEHSTETELNENGTLLAVEGSAMVELTNGKRLLITQSEWCTLWLK